MFFLNERGLELINSNYVERLCIVQKSDAALIVASYGNERPPVTLGRYADVQEAMIALCHLSQALNDGEHICMIESTYGGKQIKSDAYHGKKAKSHGGS